MAALFAACGSSAASIPVATTTGPSLTGSPVAGPSLTGSPVAGPSLTGSPVAGPSGDPGATRTFPPPQTPIDAGTYRWDGFERTISVDLGAGWSLGHDNPTFFDLFRGSTFPSITFARFSEVYVDGTKRVKAVDAASVAATLIGRKDMTIDHSVTVELGGLTGRQFDLTTLLPQTPLFFGRAGDFKLDPEFRTRYRILDLPGSGVLVVGIHTRDGGFDAGVALGDPVVATLTVGP